MNHDEVFQHKVTRNWKLSAHNNILNVSLFLWSKDTLYLLQFKELIWRHLLQPKTMRELFDKKKEQGSRPNPSTVEPSKKSSSTGPDWSEEDVRNKAT